MTDYWIEKLNLQKHPEGGYFKETYRSEGKISHSALQGSFSGDRSYSTAIYFLLNQNEFSSFHKIASDELWHFYSGNPLNVYVIEPSGNLYTIKLGPSFENGEQFQAVVPAGCWFASKVAESVDDHDTYSLVGCTVAPGFDFSDFEMAEKDKLSDLYPQHKSLISLLT